MFTRLKILPLDADQSSRFLPWTIAFMTYLAALALAGAMVLAAMLGHFDPGQASNLTVEIPPPAESFAPQSQDAGSAAETKGRETKDVQKTRMAAALDLLRATPGVIDAEALDRREVASLLEPWLGKAASMDDLPLPAVIDVTVDRNAGLDTDGIAAKLAAAVPGATLDDHGTWFARLSTFVRSVQIVAGLVVTLTCLAAVLTVVYVTLSGLAVHHDIIEMLHLIGAEDGFIARQFQGHALRLGLAGAVPGLLLAIFTMELLALAASRLDSVLLPDVHLSLQQWAALGLVPFVAAAIAVLTARITVMRRLRGML